MIAMPYFLDSDGVGGAAASGMIHFRDDKICRGSTMARPCRVIKQLIEKRLQV
jgi:hypothetical protein